jgi:hypothetical protein
MGRTGRRGSLPALVQPGGSELAELTTADIARMADLTERYADLRLGGTDASLVAIAERRAIRRIATFDRRHWWSALPTRTPSRCAGDRPVNRTRAAAQALLADSCGLSVDWPGSASR